MDLINQRLEIMDTMIALSDEEITTLKSALAIVEDLIYEDDEELVNNLINALNEDYYKKIDYDCIIDGIIFIQRLCDNSPLKFRWYSK